MVLQPNEFPLVEIIRKCNQDEASYGFILAENAEFVLLHQVVLGRYCLDGYCLLRRCDIKLINRSFDEQALIQIALHLKQQEPTPLDEIELSDLPDMMDAIQHQFHLMIIAREYIEPDEIELGVVRLASKDNYVLRWLTPDAHWELDDRTFHYRDITRLEFGTEYDQTLLKIAKYREENEN